MRCVACDREYVPRNKRIRTDMEGTTIIIQETLCNSCLDSSTYDEEEYNVISETRRVRTLRTERVW